MSFLIGRIAAAKEGSYFLQESKHAVSRLIEKNKSANPPQIQSSSNSSTTNANADTADILPEILRHSLPSKMFKPNPDSTLSFGSKWNLPSDPNYLYSISPDVLNPLKAYVSLPQVTLGPKRWQLPNARNSFQASTANDSRRDKQTPVNLEKAAAAAAGLSQFGTAFAIATTTVFGGAAVIFGFIVSELELHSGNDIRTKGKDLLLPRIEMVKEQVMPLRAWVEGMSKKWRCDKEDIKGKPFIKKLSKILGRSTSN